MLIDVHLLQNHAPSNLNRDDTGSPKDATVIASCRSCGLPGRMVLLEDTRTVGRPHERRPDGNGVGGD